MPPVDYPYITTIFYAKNSRKTKKQLQNFVTRWCIPNQLTAFTTHQPQPTTYLWTLLHKNNNISKFQPHRTTTSNKNPKNQILTSTFFFRILFYVRAVLTRSGKKLLYPHSCTYLNKLSILSYKNPSHYPYKRKRFFY